jgi:hypothetical protein
MHDRCRDRSRRTEGDAVSLAVPAAADHGRALPIDGGESDGGQGTCATATHALTSGGVLATGDEVGRQTDVDCRRRRRPGRRIRAPVAPSSNAPCCDIVHHTDLAEFTG